MRMRGNSSRRETCRWRFLRLTPLIVLDYSSDAHLYVACSAGDHLRLTRALVAVSW